MRATITTVMTTGTEALLRLLTWLSPAFPTGAFAYSHGLEWAVETNDVHDAPTLETWLLDVIMHGSGRSDVILLRHACRADADAFGALCEFALALATCRERRAETSSLGEAFVRAAQPWGGRRLAALAAEAPPYPIAVGALAADHDIDEDMAAAAYLQAMTANLISAALRLIPLGQTAGLRVLAALEPSLLALVAETADATFADIGSAAVRADIAAMRHETQYTRLFRT
jgi:urease accessory protein